MITIDDVEYDEEDLTEEAKARVERIQELQKQVHQTLLNYEELQAAMSHHAAKIKEALNVSIQPDEAND